MPTTVAALVQSDPESPSVSARRRLRQTLNDALGLAAKAVKMDGEGDFVSSMEAYEQSINLLDKSIALMREHGSLAAKSLAGRDPEQEVAQLQRIVRSICVLSLLLSLIARVSSATSTPPAFKPTGRKWDNLYTSPQHFQAFPPFQITRTHFPYPKPLARQFLRLHLRLLPHYPHSPYHQKSGWTTLYHWYLTLLLTTLLPTPTVGELPPERTCLPRSLCTPPIYKRVFQHAATRVYERTRRHHIYGCR